MNAPMMQLKQNQRIISRIPKISTKENPKIKDKIKGMIYGQAIGDYLGLYTEFMTKDECKKIYAKEQKGGILNSEMYRDFHRMRWNKGDFTDDTSQMLVLLQCFAFGGGVFNKTDFAKRFLYWCNFGFPQINDVVGNGVGKNTHFVISHPSFTSDPHIASKFIWDSLKDEERAPNGALMRSSVVGIFENKNLEKVAENSKENCKCTHHDERCVASCVYLSVCIALLLQGKTIGESMQTSLKYSINEISNEETRKELEGYTGDKLGSLQGLQIDKKGEIGYTFKCLAVGLYALTHFEKEGIEKVFYDIMNEGGDADTNLSVAGALVGACVGYSGLPELFLDKLNHKQFIESQMDLVESFVE